MTRREAKTGRSVHPVRHRRRRRWRWTIPGWRSRASSPSGSGCFVGAGLGGVTTHRGDLHRRCRRRGRGTASRRSSCRMIIVNLAPGQISIRFGAKGPNMSARVGLLDRRPRHRRGAAGHPARRRRRHDLRRRRGDRHAAGRGRLQLACGRCRPATTHPQQASRPFDKDRDGFVIAEGAGIVDPRGAGARQEARRHASTPRSSATRANADAHHITAPRPEGEGAQRCMKLALKDAGWQPADIDYINAHGTSTKIERRQRDDGDQEGLRRRTPAS